MTATADTEVIVVGAGPTGLFLAGELAIAGVPCRLLERRTHRTKESRALGLHARTLEALDLRGLADTFLATGNTIRRVRVNLGRSLVDLNKLDTRYGQMQILPQSTTELLLEEQCNELGVQVERGVRCLGVSEHADGVALRVTDGDTSWEEQARWVVGCDGSSSAVRESLGITFAGAVYPYTIIVADVRLQTPPEDALKIHIGAAGLVVSTAFGDGWYRMGVVDRKKPWSDEPVTLEEVRSTLAKLFGYDLGPSEPLWTSRFRIQERQAGSYRRGRVLLAGDAAHVHSPLGGQGLNLGIQDALNLGWKLSAVVRGDADDTILDTYVAERRRLSNGVIKATDLATRMMTSPHLGPRIMRRIAVPRALGNRRTHQIAAGYLSGIAVAYPNTRLDRDDPLGGRRLPDAPLELSDGSRTTVFALLRNRTFVLIDPAGSAAEVVHPWAKRVAHVVGRFTDRPKLASRRWLLVRPDGYCAWSGNSAAPTSALEAALLHWVGHRDRHSTPNGRGQLAGRHLKPAGAADRAAWAREAPRRGEAVV